MDQEETKETENDQSMEKQDKFYVSNILLERINNILNDMEFKCSYWYPSVSEFQEYQLKNEESDIAFAIWLIRTDMNLTKDEIVVRKHIAKWLLDHAEFQNIVFEDMLKSI